MALSDILQFSALAALPIGIALVMLAIGGPLLAAGAFFITCAPELWLVGRELDLGGDAG